MCVLPTILGETAAMIEIGLQTSELQYSVIAEAACKCVKANKLCF